MENNESKITKKDFLDFGFKELPGNQFELIGNVNGGGTFNLIVLWNGVDWYFPGNENDVHLFRTPIDLNLFKTRGLIN